MAEPMNLAMTQQDVRKNELRTVNLQLMNVIKHAGCWHDIREAADAMFHARLIWDSIYKEEQKSEGTVSGGGSYQRAQDERSLRDR